MSLPENLTIWSEDTVFDSEGTPTKVALSDARVLQGARPAVANIAAEEHNEYLNRLAVRLDTARGIGLGAMAHVRCTDVQTSTPWAPVDASGNKPPAWRCDGGDEPDYIQWTALLAGGTIHSVRVRIVCNGDSGNISGPTVNLYKYEMDSSATGTPGLMARTLIDSVSEGVLTGTPWETPRDIILTLSTPYPVVDGESYAVQVSGAESTATVDTIVVTAPTVMLLP